MPARWERWRTDDVLERYEELAVELGGSEQCAREGRLPEAHNDPGFYAEELG